MKPAARQKALLAPMLSLVLGSLAITRRDLPRPSPPRFPGRRGPWCGGCGGSRRSRVRGDQSKRQWLGVSPQLTDLNDSGSGSLRNCIIASGPRTCVFRSGGTIALLMPLKVLNPLITIAGQTAPGGGITLKNDPSSTKPPLWIQTHDVIVRYIRSRPGPSTALTESLDAIRVNGSDAVSETVGATDVHDVIIDHCSPSWAVDETIELTGAQDTTVQ